MYQKKLIKFIASTMLALPLILANTGSWGDEQILSELAVSGNSLLADDQADPEVVPGDGVVMPDLEAEGIPFYTEIVTPDSGRDFRTVELTDFGLLVLDGTVIRRYNAAGVEQVGTAFPVDCTKLVFSIPKGKERSKDETLSDCSTFIQAGSTLRVFGQSKGKSFVSVAYDPNNPGFNAVDGTWAAVRMADGTPPGIADAVADETAGLIWVVGDKRKVISFPLTSNPLDRDSEQDFIVEATINGKNLTSLAPFVDNQVIVTANTGELFSVDASDRPTRGDVSSFGVTQLPLCIDPALGKKTPQTFDLRDDPIADILYVTNEACGTITVLDAMGDPVDTNLSGMDPVVFDFDGGGADFKPNAVSVKIGQSIDFSDCTGEDIDADEVCQYSDEPNGARQFGTIVNPASDPSGRMYEFFLDDCRWTEAPDCPIVNCLARNGAGVCTSPHKTQQVLNLTELLLRADVSGEFARDAFGDPADAPLMTIPANVRGEKEAPKCDLLELFCETEPDPDPVPLEYQFVTFYAVTDTVFQGVFFTQYDVDALRDLRTNDLCNAPDRPSTVAAVNETANLILHNRDTHSTINGDTDGFVINSFCNRGGGSSFNWSAQSVGLEFHNEDEVAYLEFTGQQMDDLDDALDQLLCSDFPDPDDPTVPPRRLGPLLTGGECTSIEEHLIQIRAKQEVCHDAQLFTPQGNSNENCNAFFTKVENLQRALDDNTVITWPSAPTADLALLAPNYEGEFRSRLASLNYAMEEWFLNAIRAEGILSGAPILASIGDQPMVEGDMPVEILLSATDPNGEDMDLAVSELPVFCDPLEDDGDGTGSITCNPGLGDAADSPYATTVTVTDQGEHSLIDSETFNILVNVLP